MRTRTESKRAGALAMGMVEDKYSKLVLKESSSTSSRINIIANMHQMHIKRYPVTTQMTRLCLGQRKLSTNHRVKQEKSISVEIWHKIPVCNALRRVDAESSGKINNIHFCSLTISALNGSGWL